MVLALGLLTDCCFPAKASHEDFSAKSKICRFVSCGYGHLLLTVLTASALELMMGLGMVGILISVKSTTRITLLNTKYMINGVYGPSCVCT